MNKESSKDEFLIKPYWVQENLCTEKQFDWWYNSTNYLFQSKTSKMNSKSISQIDSNIDEPLSFNIDSKKQNELSKILELVRLKSASIKYHSKNENKFKLNIKICISIAKYLQYLNDSLNRISLTGLMSPSKLKSNQTTNNPDEKFTLSLVASPESIHSPKEKQSYLKYYLIKYWQYVIDQLIKLKHMPSLDQFDANDSMVLKQDNSLCLNDSNLTMSTLVSRTGQLSIYENFFIFTKNR